MFDLIQDGCSYHYSLPQFPPLGNVANGCIRSAAEDTALATLCVAGGSWDWVTCACTPCPRSRLVPGPACPLPFGVDQVRVLLGNALGLAEEGPGKDLQWPGHAWSPCPPLEISGSP